MDIVSAAPSAIQSEAKGGTSVKYGSDFGGLFVQDSNGTMRRWMTTNTVYEFEGANNPMSAPSEADTVQARTEYSSDSGLDLEKDMLRAVFTNGKRCKDTGGLSGAERRFQGCLSRPQAFSPSSSPSPCRDLL